MMNKKLVLFLLIINSLLFSQTTYEFLRVDVSPRAAGMGGSFVAANDDPDVIFYNPAGLATLTGTPISFSYVKYLLDINFAGLSVSRNFDNIGRFGAGIKYVNYGTFTGADENGAKLPDFGAGEIVFDLAYSNFLSDNFSYGGATKFIYSSIQKYSSTALGFDAGLNYSIPQERWNFAISMLNMGGQLSSYASTTEQIPFEIVVGVSKRLQNLPLKFHIDFHRLNDNSTTFGQRFNAFTVGGELNLSKVLKLRAGYDNKKRKD